MQRYVILNAQNQIVGRCKWDGVSAWTPPEGQRAMLETAAIAAGYTDAPAADANPRVITPREFMDRLSAQTQAAIAAAATNSGKIMLLLIRLNGGDVRLDADETKAGVAAMQAARLITAAEAAALLA